MEITKKTWKILWGIALILGITAFILEWNDIPIYTITYITGVFILGIITGAELK